MRREPFGSWRSPVGAELAVAGGKGFGDLQAAGDALFWTEPRPDEGGRAALMRAGSASSRAGGAPARELAPAPFNARSRVHEYGGGAFCVGEDAVYCVNFADQNIHSIDLRSGAIRQVTATDAGVRYGDLVWDGSAIVAVREIHDGSAQPRNDLARIEPGTGAETQLHAGHDFYSSPCPSGDGRLAFLAWDHPRMPWDGTRLMVGAYAGEYGEPLGAARAVAGGDAESIVQPAWRDGMLLFVSDAGGYWNLHARDASGTRCILEDAAEYAGPAWQFGARYYAPVDAGRIVARRIEDGAASLVLVDIAKGRSTPLHDGCASYSGLCRTPGGVAFVAGYADRASEVVELRLDTGTWMPRSRSDDSPVPRDAISVPRPIHFRSEGGFARALFYAPRNADLAGLEGEAPPLLVTTHGGPTSAATRELAWRVQFYTSRGWAVADIDYRGSTGYGRAYREQLNGRWGELDVADCVACVRELAALGHADAQRAAIRGGSAGGYTTLAALAFSDAFRAGASHYGVGDLRALERDTHKFESRYLDTLTGGGDALDARSPINHIDRLNCPAIFFQGADDKVVPPNQARMMRDALRRKGLPVAYIEFEGEGHGFRRAENIRRAIEAEYAFFCRIFGIRPAGGLAAAPIENAPGADADGTA